MVSEGRPINCRVYLLDVYQRLFKHFGAQRWWPAESKLEVVIGAILTQNTSWSNVEKAIARLKQEGLLSAAKLHRIDLKKLAVFIRPSGYYNLKAARLKNFIGVLFAEFGGELSRLFALSRQGLRKKLLTIKGIGCETADSIILYAAGKPVFVVDAYTKRFLLRHKLIGPEAGYAQIQRFFETNLPRSRKLFNEYHALIVRLAKEFCGSKPLCAQCPLRQSRKRWN